jgi:drug/metabolite transporter (DMT)-like permease
MTLQGMLLVVLAALLTVAANLLLRGGLLRAGGFCLSVHTLIRDIFTLCKEPLFIIGAVLYAAAALVWFRVISTEQLSNSYPMLVSLTFVFVTAGAVVFFHESFSWMKILGTAIILVGIVLVARSSGG